MAWKEQSKALMFYLIEPCQTLGGFECKKIWVGDQYLGSILSIFWPVWKKQRKQAFEGEESPTPVIFRDWCKANDFSIMELGADANALVANICFLS